MLESEFVRIALDVARSHLELPFSIEQGKPLLYKIALDNNLELVPQERKAPRRGQSAFETDLCVFDEVKRGTLLPRVVLEFKTRLTTHGVITYNAKARKHKQIYPYLRYGMVFGAEGVIPGRFFTHNESLDFCLALDLLGDRATLASEFLALIDSEIQASKRLEAAAFGTPNAYLYRSEVLLESHPPRTVDGQPG